MFHMEKLAVGLNSQEATPRAAATADHFLVTTCQMGPSQKTPLQTQALNDMCVTIVECARTGEARLRHMQQGEMMCILHISACEFDAGMQIEWACCTQ